jgi:hypothetical protein
LISYLMAIRNVLGYRLGGRTAIAFIPGLPRIWSCALGAG